MKFSILANEIKLMPKSKEHKPEPQKASIDEGGFEDDAIPF